MKARFVMASLFLGACTWKNPSVDPSTWLDTRAFNFTAHWLDTPGGRMHYIDEGEGPAVVLVHGTPTWSFLYRDLIADLTANGYRCIAMDHIGYGLSDKPTDWVYTPQAHSENVTRLLDHLDIEDATLVVHDVGGPIGLGAAITDPDRFDRLVIFNTWMWSLDDNPKVQRLSKVIAGPMGQYLYLKRNYSPRKLIPLVFEDKSRLEDAAHEHYIRPFSAPDSRTGPWRTGTELAGSADYYDRLWQQREALADKAALFIWGMDDPTFQPEDLERWQTVFPDASVLSLAGVGHFPQEEAPAQVRNAVRDFLAVAQHDGVY